LKTDIFCEIFKTCILGDGGGEHWLVRME